MDKPTHETAELAPTASKEPFLCIWRNREDLENDASGQSVAEYLGCGCSFAAISKS